MPYTPESEEEAEFLRSYDPTKFPVTVVTVDMIVHTDTHVLLIKRGNWPYKGEWALPGGFIDPGETTAVAAVRELREEAGLNLMESQVEFVGIADAPDRDPRCRAISFVYSARVPEQYALYAEDDAVEAEWIPFWLARNKRSLAFDHANILGLFMLQLSGGL